nr:MAG TPA: hypothetical protein [Myoviridae sp. ctTfa5]
MLFFIANSPCSLFSSAILCYHAGKGKIMRKE